MHVQHQSHTEIPNIWGESEMQEIMALDRRVGARSFSGEWYLCQLANNGYAILLTLQITSFIACII